MLESLIAVRGDARYALRLLRRAPGFAAVATATLALGIGATTAIFTVVDAVLLRPLQFAAPHQLVMVRWSSGARVSPRYVREWRSAKRTVADLAGWEDVRVNRTGLSAPLEVQADRATTNFFELLGAEALIGRTFTVHSSLASVEPEVILSHAFWQQRYAGDPRIVGRSITLDGEAFTIVGVMPARFAIRTNELAESRAELWLPMRLTPDVIESMGGRLNVIGRLAPRVAPVEAQAELAAISARIDIERPSFTTGWRVEVVPLLTATVKDVRLTLVVLFGAVGSLLLIACANVANLILTRVAVREPELAIRRSLGATSTRVLRQLVTEALVLSVIGGVLGVLLAIWGTHALVSLVPPALELPRLKEITPNGRVLVLASLTVLAVAVVVGLAPWLTSGRPSLQAGLREASRGVTIGRHRRRLGGVLAILELALALTLLAGAGLFTRSFWQLSLVNPGFQTDHLLTLRTTLPSQRFDTPARIRAFAADLLERRRRLPGVQSAGIDNYLPLTNFGVGGSFAISGRPAQTGSDRPGSWISVVGGDYFKAMSIPLLRGRLFSVSDNEQTAPVFVIDEQLARRYWPGEDPVGKRVTWTRDEIDETGAHQQAMTGEIIGVVGSVRWGGLAASPQATTYWWLPQAPDRHLTIVARAIGDQAAIAAAIGDEVHHIDPDQPASDIRAVRDLVSDDLLRPRFTMGLLSVFAAAALLLAAIGLYGVIAFGVAQQTREIGVRIALGARRRDVMDLVLRRGLKFAAAGLAIGLSAALALGKLVTDLVYGIAPGDPLTLTAATVFLALVALVATYLPARRAARVDPMVAMRSE